MRDVDDEHIHARANQLRGALEIVARRADRRADAQPSAGVARGERHAPLAHEVPRRDEADQRAVRVDERQLLDLALDHDPLGVLGLERAFVDDELRDRRHPVRHARAAAGHEAHVALRQQAGKPAVLVDDDERADAGTRHQRGGLVERGVRSDARRIGDHAVLRPLDDLDLAHLRLDFAGPEPAVDDADAPFFGLHDGHRRARDRVHVGRHDRPLQRDAARQPRRQIDDGRIAALEHAALRREEVVERAAAHELEHPAADGRVYDGECGHAVNTTYLAGGLLPASCGRSSSFLQKAGKLGANGGGVPLPRHRATLRERLAGTLPGIAAQMRFAPDLLRKAWRTGQFPAESRVAAALLLLYPHESGAAIALTVRASGLAHHPGQISLPGGATDPGETLVQAALREAAEEIGVDPASVRVLGELTPVHVLVSGFTLHPIVGVTDRRPDFLAAPGEVEEILEVSLHDLRDASRIRQGTGSRRRRGGISLLRPPRPPGLGRDRDGARRVHLPARRR